MISKELIRETLAQTDQTLLAYRELIPDQAHYFLFPFTLQGCINVTETVSSLKHSALMMTLFFMKRSLVTPKELILGNRLRPEPPRPGEN